MGGVYSGLWSAKPTQTMTKREKFLQDRRKCIDEMLNNEDKRKHERNIHHPNILTKMPSILNEIETRVLTIDPKDHTKDYPFENLVFNGGGAKMISYVGAVKCLEDMGIMKNIKRFAGASAGSIIAALMAAGITIEDYREVLDHALMNVFDAGWGYLSLIPNLLYHFGWHPNVKVYEIIGKLFEKQLGNKDITFKQFYEQTGKEVCIVVTNLNYLKEEYCHPKTTPDMPVRLAIRMSCSFPGVMQAIQYTHDNETNTYTDGGVSCYYPICCFDGWWLSMKKGDSFIEKLHPLDDVPILMRDENRFKTDPATFNKTLGFYLYAESGSDHMKFELEKRLRVHDCELPDTRLARKMGDQRRFIERASREHRRVVLAADEFLKVVRKMIIDNSIITKETFEHAFVSDFVREESFRILFGDECTVEEAFEILDDDGNGEISYNELVEFIQGIGVHIQERISGLGKLEINSFSSFMFAMFSSFWISKDHVDLDKDLDRTVGINTVYVDTHDYTMEKEDIAFLEQQGYNATMTFLRYFIAKSEFQSD
ncbi:uncharacterized protein LOC125647015 [Ostrea edulis]|uniref:uncharacterized protein LOC125647015 n=1 Tax=Ostrea edulis TaxID=37623 RepID=UPI0024AF833C|nr:uncharacterized protein LOC125647015 [Ostrea edulis]